MSRYVPQAMLGPLPVIDFVATRKTGGKGLSIEVPRPERARSADVLIRIADPREYDAVGRLTLEGFGHRRSDGDPDLWRRRELLLNAGARAEGGMLLVAESLIDHTLVGTASLLRSGGPLTRQAREDEAEIRLVAVLPGSRRVGVATRLLTAALDVAREWRVEAVVLDTGEHNLRSQRVYHRIGFERALEREKGPGPGDRRLAVFRYDLGPTGLMVRLIRPGEEDAVARLMLGEYGRDRELAPEERGNLLAIAERAARHEVWVAADRSDGSILGTVSTPRPGESLSEFAGSDELDAVFLAAPPSRRRCEVTAVLARHLVDLARARRLSRIVVNSDPGVAPELRAPLGLGLRCLEHDALEHDGAELECTMVTS